MHQSVRDAWIPFSAKFEGVVSWMYLDVKGLVTIGIGNLIDPISLGLTLPFRRFSDGQLATVQEIRDEWTYLKSLKHLAVQGHRAARGHCKLYLADSDIHDLVISKLSEFEHVLKATFPRWGKYPADVQLAVLSMAWAMGPYFTKTFTTFTRAVREESWMLASRQCLMRTTNNPGLVPRNRANVKAFLTAASESDQGIEVLRSF
jgi:GH24 family phage-related lysozyme (muramidase)